MRDNKQLIFVVGASGGIGRTIAQDLLDTGYDLAVGSRARRPQIDNLVEHAYRLGRICVPIEIELRDRKTITQACTFVIENLGTPIAFINCAGMRVDRSVLRMMDEEWDEVNQVNLASAFSLARQMANAMMKQRRGRIIHIASVSAFHNLPGQANYSASKAGLIALTRTMARELGAFGITVNAIAPGFIETEMTRSLPDAVRRRYLAQIPVRRFGVPADLLPLVRMLLAPESSYITGQVLVVDGGLTA